MVLGCMMSGKSSWTQHEVRRQLAVHRRVICFKSYIDTHGDDPTKHKNHDDQSIAIVPVKAIGDIYAHLLSLPEQPHLVVFEETQFLALAPPSKLARRRSTGSDKDRHPARPLAHDEIAAPLIRLVNWIGDYLGADVIATGLDGTFRQEAWPWLQVCTHDTYMTCLISHI